MTTIQVKGKVNKKLEFLAQIPSWIKEGAYQIVIILLQQNEQPEKSKQLIFSDHNFPINGMTFSRFEIYDEYGR